VHVGICVIIFNGIYHTYRGVALLGYQNTETIPKQSLQIMQGRPVFIYRRIWCMLEVS